MNTVKHRLSQLSRLNHLTLASLLSLSAAAQAQTSWTATKLSAPLGARFYDYHPTLLNDQGGVQSGHQHLQHRTHR
jgi:hypothetical protein